VPILKTISVISGIEFPDWPVLGCVVILGKNIGRTEERVLHTRHGSREEKKQNM
jgi:hypothetical protein